MATSIIKNMDYVIEQGTSGIWTYRKWKSGIKECWCNSTTGTSYTMSANGALYISSDLEIALPSGLFTATPTVQGMILTGGGMWVKCTGSTSSSKIVYTILRTNTTVASLNYSFYCIGK